MIVQRSLADKIKDRISETATAELILPRHKSMLIKAIDEERLDFRVPQTVTARIGRRDDPDYAFDTLRCSHCGRMYSFQEAAREGLRCRHCGGRPKLSAAPVFVANFATRPPTPLRFSEAVRKVSYDWNSNHCIYKQNPTRSGRTVPADFIKGLKESERRRPIDSLCWTCPIPDEPCDWRDANNYCTFSKWDRSNNNFRPDRWANTDRIRLVPPPSKTKSSFGTFIDRYRPVTASEGITKPIRIAIHNYSDQDVIRLRFNEEELRGISEILFVKKLDVFQFTIALAIGLPYISIKKRLVNLFVEESPDGEDHLYVLSRRLTTEGIVIRLKADVVQNIAIDWQANRPQMGQEAVLATLYHTVSHAFLKPLPMIAGLDASEFHESFSPKDNEVALYDDSPGGIGGVRTLLEESSKGPILRGDYSAQLLNSLTCQLDCSWSCKACLHTDKCGWINRQLKRDMLETIVDERFRNRYFST